MKIDIVLGLCWGDEGKGNVVNALSTEESLVVRFNGGHQAAHNVVHDGRQHIFSSFGSGTLKGAKTYISEYCTVYPPALIQEKEALGFYPKLYINGDAMLTTPFDIEYNRFLDTAEQNGTVGVGFGATIARHEAGYKLYVRDLWNPIILNEKIKLIRDRYYDVSFNDMFTDEIDSRVDQWLLDTIDLIEHYTMVEKITDIPYFWKHLIFEGAQGIMLDMDYGFFPHVTRSNTTSKNALAIIDTLNVNNTHSPLEGFDTYYVTRAYATRHGNGLLPNRALNLGYIEDNPNETNVENYQGEFRKGVLDLHMMKYALGIDRKINNSFPTLVMTCLDQVNKGDGTTLITISERNFDHSAQEIADMLEIDSVVTSYSPSLDLQNGK